MPAADAFAWHERPGAFERLVPPWERVRVVERHGTIRDGDGAVLELRRGPLRRRWVAVHRDHVPGVQFADEQESGPFAAWSHVHRFEPDPDGSAVVDEITYRLPLGRVGELAAGRVVDRTLERTFAFRHRRLADDLGRHRRHPAALRVAITGTSGLVGSTLASFLESGGHEVVRVVRRAAAAGEVRWDPRAGVIDGAGLDGVDAVVHLAGEPIAARWSAARKREIARSRIEGTRLVAEALASLPRPPRVLVSSSAVGYYGNRGDAILTEGSAPGDDFLAGVGRAWEDATRPAAAAGVRVVHLRTGVVLEALLERIAAPFRAGAGGRLGSGRQWLSWIALDDLLGAVQHVLATEELVGAVNAVAPHPCTNAELTRRLGRVLGRPTLLPLPAFAVRAALGEMGEAVLLGSQRVLPGALSQTAFRWSYPELDAALRHVLGRA